MTSLKTDEVGNWVAVLVASRNQHHQLLAACSNGLSSALLSVVILLYLVPEVRWFNQAIRPGCRCRYFDVLAASQTLGPGITGV